MGHPLGPGWRGGGAFIYPGTALCHPHHHIPKATVSSGFYLETRVQAGAAEEAAEPGLLLPRVTGLLLPRVPGLLPLLTRVTSIL